MSGIGLVPPKVEETQLYSTGVRWQQVTSILPAGWQHGDHLLLAGNTIAHNWTPGHGGGVYMGGDGGAADLMGNTVRENTAGGDGGGIYLDDSADPTPILSNTVTANVAGGNGGGIYLGTTTATVQGNTFQDNQAGADGGGGYGQGMWSANTFADNEAAGRGGGVCAGGTLMGNVVISNTALAGGGICLDEHSDALLVNNWIIDNQATSQGSGLLLTGPQPRLVHNTIAYNTGGAGLHVAFSSGYTSVVALTNTILVSHEIGISVTAGCTATLEATLWGNDTDWAGGGLSLIHI